MLRIYPTFTAHVGSLFKKKSLMRLFFSQSDTKGLVMDKTLTPSLMDSRAWTIPMDYLNSLFHNNYSKWRLKAMWDIMRAILNNYIRTMN